MEWLNLDYCMLKVSEIEAIYRYDENESIILLKSGTKFLINKEFSEFKELFREYLEIDIPKKSGENKKERYGECINCSPLSVGFSAEDIGLE